MKKSLVILLITLQMLCFFTACTESSASAPRVLEIQTETYSEYTKCANHLYEITSTKIFTDAQVAAKRDFTFMNKAYSLNYKESKSYFDLTHHCYTFPGHDDDTFSKIFFYDDGEPFLIIMDPICTIDGITENTSAEEAARLVQEKLSPYIDFNQCPTLLAKNYSGYFDLNWYRVINGFNAERISISKRCAMKKLCSIMLKKAITFFCLLCCLSGCSMPSEAGYNHKTENYYDHTSALIWLHVDSLDDLPNNIPPGTVTLSDNLQRAIAPYSDDTVFALIVSFASMIPSNYLDTLFYKNISASELHREAIGLIETDPEKAKLLLGKYNELTTDFFNAVIESIRPTFTEAGMPVDLLTEFHQEEFFFYTCATKKQLAKLKCKENEAFYIAGGSLYK